MHARNPTARVGHRADGERGVGLVEVIAAHAGPGAYRVEPSPGGVIETALPVRVLPAADTR